MRRNKKKHPPVIDPSEIVADFGGIVQRTFTAIVQPISVASPNRPSLLRVPVCKLFGSILLLLLHHEPGEVGAPAVLLWRNGVITEVPRLPIVNFHGKMWQNVAKRMGSVAPL